MISGSQADKKARTLVVYYSQTGNTRAVAERIRDLSGGDLVELVPVDPYPDDYSATTQQAKRELQSGYKPPLQTKVENVGAYDIICVGSPNWWSTVAGPVKTFLSDYDLSGKTLAPFITHDTGQGIKSRGRTRDENPFRYRFDHASGDPGRQRRRPGLFFHGFRGLRPGVQRRTRHTFLQTSDDQAKK